MITYMNFRFARTGGQINTSFYASDGALEEALTELSRFSYNAEVKAWDEVNQQAYLVEPLWVNFLNDVYLDIDNDLLTIDEGNQIISDAVRGIFETAYYNELLSSVSGVPAFHNFYNATLLGTNKYLDYGGYTGISFLSDAELKTNILNAINTTVFNPTEIIAPSDSNPADIDSVVVKDIAVSNEIRLTISSDGTYHEKNKRITVDVSLLPPNYNFNIATKTESISLHKNDITDQALAAKGSIVFQEGISVVDGNIYGYGNQIDFYYNQPRQNYGGIKVGDGTTPISVTVTGNVASRNGLNLYAPNSSINIGDSVFVNNVYVAPSADDVVLTVGKDIYMYSDLFIGADRAQVNIETTNPDASLNRLNLDVSNYIPSSGNLIGLLALHPVAKDGYTRTGSIIVSETVEDPSITLNGLFLNGVVRYDLTEKDHFKATGEASAYKTGESFTTNHNKTYYQTLGLGSIYQSGVISFLEEFIVDTDFDSEDISNLVSLISFNSDIDATLNQKEFRAIHFYTMGYEAYLESLTGSAPYALREISSTDKSIIKVRNPIRTADANKTFYGINANGLIQFKEAGSVDSGKIYHPNIINTMALNNNQGTLSNKIDLSANILGYSDYTQIGSGTYLERNLFDHWLNVSANPVLPLQSTDTKVAIYNDDPNVDIYINYDDNHAGHIDVKGQSYLSGEIFEGTIVTKGNVFVYSSDSMTFRGNIISEKDIFLTGPGQKNIVHDELIIYSAINKSSDLRNLYLSDVGRQLITSGTMYNNDFTASVQNNSAEINVNTVNDMINSGTTIIDSRSMHINSWFEE